MKALVQSWVVSLARGRDGGLLGLGPSPRELSVVPPHRTTCRGGIPGTHRGCRLPGPKAPLGVTVPSALLRMDCKSPPHTGQRGL